MHGRRIPHSMDPMASKKPCGEAVGALQGPLGGRILEEVPARVVDVRQEGWETVLHALRQFGQLVLALGHQQLLVLGGVQEIPAPLAQFLQFPGTEIRIRLVQDVLLDLGEAALGQEDYLLAGIAGAVADDRPDSRWTASL